MAERYLEYTPALHTTMYPPSSSHPGRLVPWWRCSDYWSLGYNRSNY